MHTHVCLIHFFHAVMAPIVMEFSASPFSISITWTSSGAMVDSYEVLWDRATPDDCPDEHTGSATVSGTAPRSYDITGLFGDSAYMIRVNATNAAGSAISGSVVVFTEEHGNPLPNYVCNVCSMPFSPPPPPAPTARPASLTPSDITPNSFTIQWGRVPCLYHNGDITGYRVLVQGNGSMRSMDISGSDVLNTNITELASDTRYMVQVAGVNGQGIGVYRDLTVDTPQS